MTSSIARILTPQSGELNPSSYAPKFFSGGEQCLSGAAIGLTFVVQVSHIRHNVSKASAAGNGGWADLS